MEPDNIAGNLKQAISKIQALEKLTEEEDRKTREREQTEQALFQAEEKYRNIFEHAIEGIFQSTPDGPWPSRIFTPGKRPPCCCRAWPCPCPCSIT